MTRRRNNVELSAVWLSDRSRHAAILPTTNGKGTGRDNNGGNDKWKHTN